jgi:hypothetical protein
VASSRLARDTLQGRFDFGTRRFMQDFCEKLSENLKGETLMLQRNILKWCLAIFLGLVISLSTFPLEAVEVSQGPAPMVQAQEDESETVVPLFHMSDDGPPLRPNHPPIDQIPPMDMPDDSGQAPASTEPLMGVSYDAETDEIRLSPIEDAADLLEGSMQGGGYNGADGGLGVEEWESTFNTMSLISTTGDAPWRMNAKVVLRFEDSGGTSHYAVCSGTMRDAEVVLTAGHCVYDRSHSWGWAKEAWIYPGWDGVGGQWNPPPTTINPYGFGQGTYFSTLTGWANSGDWNYDLGLIRISRAVGVLTGWFGYAYGGDCSCSWQQRIITQAIPLRTVARPAYNGLDMYYWNGHFDSCPEWNRLQLDTSGGCFDAVWGGMSGSGAYYIEGGGRYVHALCSTSNRSTYARYTRQTQSWVDFTNNTFIPDSRGSTFDLQALDVNAVPATLKQGESTTTLNHLAANPTNGTRNATFTFRVYLSTNDNISTTDTLLSTQTYMYSFPAMGSVTVNMVQVTIPYNTPPGNYWLGVIYDNATDGITANNQTDGWDAFPITVTLETTPPTPNPMTWQTQPNQLDQSQIRMTASTASDPTPTVQYGFDFVSSPTGGTGGTDSAWQSGTTYTDAGLQTNHQYGYRVRARDGNGNVTTYSSTLNAYTSIETPTGITFGAVTPTSIQAQSTNTPSGLTRGTSGLFVVNDTAGSNSGWKQNNDLWNSSGLSPNTRYTFRTMARNGDGDTTPYSPTGSKYTLANAPAAAGFSNITLTGISANWTANGNPAGTNYYCENITRGTNSGWISTPYWDSAGLTCGTSYVFRVKARNAENVETGWTELGSQTTTVCPLKILVMSPNGGEIVNADSSHRIEWSSPPEAVSFNLSYSEDNGVTWKVIQRSVAGNFYDWRVPKPANNRTKCFVKIVGFDGSGVKVGTDKSNAPFMIEVVRLTSPDGGDVWGSNTQHSINWTTHATSRPVAKTVVFLTTNGGTTWVNIGTLAGNPGTFPWTVKPVASPKTKCKIKVVLKDAGGATVGSDLSNAPFTINP